ncbi:hypothetical protein Tco_0031402 [Tanacetum coccineum]
MELYLLGVLFENLCNGYEVIKYIKGSSEATSTSTTIPLTPEELKVDNIVLSWILMTLSDTLQARLVVEYPRSAKEACDLKSDIFNTTKDLALFNDDVVTFALEGLPDKYDHVCGIITHCEPFSDLKTTCSMLNTKDMRLKSKSLALPVDLSSSSPMIDTAYSNQLNTAYRSSDTVANDNNAKVIKEEFEKLESLKISDDPFTCNTSLESFHKEFSQMSRMDDDLFTYEVEIPGLASISCDLNKEDDSEQQMTHGSDADMEYDPSNVEFTE